MPCGWEGNRRSGVALAMHHRSKQFIHLQAHGLDREISTLCLCCLSGVWIIYLCLSECNDSLLPGLWHDSLHITCGLTACTPGSAPGPTLGYEYGKTLPLPVHPIVGTGGTVFSGGHFVCVCACVCVYPGGGILKLACLCSLSGVWLIYLYLSILLLGLEALCFQVVSLSAYVHVCVFTQVEAFSNWPAVEF